MKFNIKNIFFGIRKGLEWEGSEEGGNPYAPKKTQMEIDTKALISGN